MATIVFYDTNPIDNAQLEAGMQGTDHHWQFQPASIGQGTINPEAEVISVFVTSKVTAEFMTQMPRLRLIATRSTGFDHIDLAYAAAHDITVLNVPSYGENTVAEHAFTLLLALARHLPASLEATKDGIYAPINFTGFDLKGRTLGVIGMGRIGQHSARIGRGFEMNVIASDVHENPDTAAEIGFSYVTFDELIAQADVITLHAPLTPENTHLINAATLSRMKRGVVILNTARGELVDSRDLIAALESGQVAAAGLDTLEGEKFLHEDADIEAILGNATPSDQYVMMAETDALLRMPNVVVTPHSAYNTAEAIQRINSTTTQNIIRYWYGETPNKVPPAPHI